MLKCRSRAGDALNAGGHLAAGTGPRRYRLGGFDAKMARVPRLNAIGDFQEDSPSETSDARLAALEAKSGMLNKQVRAWGAQKVNTPANPVMPHQPPARRDAPLLRNNVPSPIVRQDMRYLAQIGLMQRAQEKLRGFRWDGNPLLQRRWMRRGG
jgi:hypothetical protein